VEATIVGPLDYSNEALFLQLRLSLKNSGNSPAINVRTTTKSFLVWMTEIDVVAVQADLCNSISSGSDFGFTVFPGKTADDDAFLQIDDKEIQKFKRAEKEHYIVPIIIGCTAYQDTTDFSAHHTGFAYLVHPNATPPPSFELPKQPIPPMNLRLGPWVSGSRAD
jgi:hypothetical protein